MIKNKGLFWLFRKIPNCNKWQTRALFFIDVWHITYIYLRSTKPISMSTGGLALYWNFTAQTSVQTLKARARVSFMPCRKYEGTANHGWAIILHVIGMVCHLFIVERRKRCFVLKRSSLLFSDGMSILISILGSLDIRSFCSSRRLELRGYHWKRFVVALVNNIINDKNGTTRANKGAGLAWCGEDQKVAWIRFRSRRLTCVEIVGSLLSPYLIWFDKAN